MSVSGKLSSRVMNMKFMRFTKEENEDGSELSPSPTPEAVQGTRLLDNSEWDTIAADRPKRRITIPIARKTSNDVPIVVGGPGDLQSPLASIATRGRRTMTKDGAVAKRDDTEHGEKRKHEDESQSGDNYDPEQNKTLEELMKESKVKKASKKKSKKSKKPKKH